MAYYRPGVCPQGDLKSTSSCVSRITSQPLPFSKPTMQGVPCHPPSLPLPFWQTGSHPIPSLTPATQGPHLHRHHPDQGGLHYQGEGLEVRDVLSITAF